MVCRYPSVTSKWNKITRDILIHKNEEERDTTQGMLNDTEPDNRQEDWEKSEYAGKSG